LDNDIDSVLIFEDDATFSRRFSTDVRAFLNSLPSDWAYIYLGGQHIQQHLGLPQKVNEWTYRPFNINRTHAYALRGRRMLQRVYDHLQDPESWTSLHHVDHRMGELHKVLESGLYVPKKWLVAQAPGQSNINGMKLPVRAFHGAQWLDDPQVDLRMVAVLGPYSSGTSAVAGMLHQLGISMGGAFQESDEVNDRGSFEAVGLADLCRKFFDEPWLTEQVRPELRTKLLRIWAANRRDYRDHPDKLAGAKHPLLCMMGPEISEAWDNPAIVSVLRDPGETVASLARRGWNWPMDAIASATQQLMLSRDIFLADYAGPQLHVRYEDVVRAPRAVIEKLAGFLSVAFTPAQVDKAVSHIRPN
jgi:hypothetical protein